MIRKTAVALLVALVASFALSSPVDAAPKKTPRARAKHSSHATTGTKRPAAKRKAAKKKATVKKATAKAKSTKRKPATKPR
jgi:hypothetical protein